MQRVSTGIVVCLGAPALLATAPVATATSQTDLADWLSRAAVHVEAIHKAENDAYTLIRAQGKIDEEKLKASCDQLRGANEALRDVMPAPNSGLTVEVQQAIDNFESASESCTDYFFAASDPAKLSDFWSHSVDAEQHLASADTILVTLAQQ